MEERLRALEAEVAALRAMLAGPSLDPTFKRVLIQQVGVRYGTTAPAHTPDKETELWVIYDGVNLRLYAWANAGWHYATLT
jgi:hypothetical protein